MTPGLIHPSSSSVGMGFFFVQKDGSLWPTVKALAKYSLPFIDAAFSPLHKARSFNNLDLQNPDQLIWIHQGDKWITAFNTAIGHVSGHTV